jgi:hypothetical protein
MLKIFLIAAAVIGVGYYMNADYNASMEKCQVKHSFDTCFYSLNH